MIALRIGNMNHKRKQFLNWSLRVHELMGVPCESVFRIRVITQNVVVLLLMLLSTQPTLAQTIEKVSQEDSQISESFAELDALSAAITNRLQDLAPHIAIPAPSHVALPPSAVVNRLQSSSFVGDADVLPSSPTSVSNNLAGAGTQPAQPKQCGTREEIDLDIDDMEGQFNGFRQIINEANDDLPSHRDNVRDIEKVCTPQVEGSIEAAVSRLNRLQIEPVYDVAVELLECIDQQRRMIDEDLNRPEITPIRTSILTDRLDRLTDMTHRVQEMEQLFLRAVSKRSRLVQELIQFKQEIISACDS